MSKERDITTLALIGKGQWGSNYITTIDNLDNCRLPKEYIKTRDYSELFQHPDIQGIIVATPTSTHLDISRECLIQGYNVLIEKPVTKTLEEAQELQITAKEHPGIIMVGHLLLYDPGYEQLKRLVPRIGKITHVHFSGLKSPVRIDATPLEDWLPHPIYLFIDLLGKKPKEILTRQTGTTTFHVELRFDNDITGSIDIGWEWPQRKREIVITGETGILTLDSGINPRILSFSNNNSSESWPLDFKRSALEYEVLEFVNCVTTGKKPKTGLLNGIEVMRVIECANQSLQSGVKPTNIS